MNMQFPKRPRVQNRRYLDAVHDMPCTTTGYERSVMGGPDVEPAHIAAGNYARGMKASDWHVLPLVHHEHAKHDKNPAAYWLDALSIDKWLLMEMVKSHAKWRYIRWILDTGGDVEAAVRQIAKYE